MKKKLLTIFLVSVASVTTVLGLQWYADSKTNQSNAFIRRQPPFLLKPLWFKKLNARNYYLAGSDSANIYLGNKHYRSVLLKVNMLTRDTISCPTYAANDFRVTGNVKLQVIDSSVYLYDAPRGIVCKAPLQTFRFGRPTQTSSYTTILPASPGSFILKILTANGNMLAKESGSRNLAVDSVLLQKQVDGFFCTDGTLVTVPTTGKIIYTYLYRNEIICADTNLRLIYRAKTIDTCTHANIKVSNINSDGELTLSSPPRYVNKSVCANKANLFVWSALKAENETAETFNRTAVIDVYAVANGQYRFSFYLPDFNNEKVKEFKVFNDKLIVLFDTYVYLFKLTF